MQMSKLPGCRHKRKRHLSHLTTAPHPPHPTTTLQAPPIHPPLRRQRPSASFSGFCLCWNENRPCFCFCCCCYCLSFHAYSLCFSSRPGAFQEGLVIFRGLSIATLSFFPVVTVFSVSLKSVLQFSVKCKFFKFCNVEVGFKV